jgi:hypothetical protein
MKKDLKNIEIKEQVEPAYQPADKELKIQKYLKKRIPILKDTKKGILDGFDFEQVMKDADKEYIPSDLRKKKGDGGIVLIQDEVKGLRGSRIVPIGDLETEEWRSNISEPTLMVKIETALSILVNNNPEAIFRAVLPKYQKNTKLAYSLWKRNWELANSERQLKLFIFDLAKYGWAIGRTYPRIEQRECEILEELDLDDPNKNKYKSITITEYNDVYREKLDPYRTWIDDMTNLTDPWSMDDWYFEKDYSWDSFKREFGKYSNFKYITKGFKDENDGNNIIDRNEETKKRDDTVTVGFYESKNKDLYVIWVPEQDIPLYYSPLPNDSKKLSCWQTCWNIRDPRTPYGIGLYEILKNNKVLYDRLKNMTIDQLVMAIYPMLFYTGNNAQGEGSLTISPGAIKQKLPGTTIDQVLIKYDPRGWDGVERVKADMDDNTGITPTLQGEIEGKTLGEVLHAKDSALKRLSNPLKNISQVLEDEAYITLSWMSQIYSIPEVKEFADEEELMKYEKESGNQSALAIKTDEGITADYYKNVELGLEADREGTLIESPDKRFFQIGKDINTADLKWEGKISIKAESVVSASQELDRQRKLELFNLVQPTVSQICSLYYQKIDPQTGQPFSPEGSKEYALAMYKPVKQILEIQNEKPENWVPKEIVDLADDPEALAAMREESKSKELIAQQQQAAMAGGMGGGMGGLMTTPEELEAQAKGKPGQQAQSVVPQNEVSNPMRAMMGQLERPR